MERRTWTDEMVVSESRKVAEAIGRFPSVQDLKAMGRNDLAVQIGRRGGYIAVSEKAGIPRNHSDSDTGWEGEAMFLDLLISLGIPAIRMDGKRDPFDILVQGCLKVDVKAARYAAYGACRGWFYRIGKVPQADVIALVQLDTKSAYILPWYICPQTNITISQTGGKYARFMNRYDIIQKMVAARLDEQSLAQSMVE